MSRKIIGITVGTQLPKPNFDQTDPRKGDYIKNKPILSAVASSGSWNDLTDKPFYEEKTEGYIIPETTVEIDVESNGEGHITEPPNATLIVGETYIVNWNGTEYSCVAHKYDIDGAPVTGHMLGNYDLAMGGEGTGEPFVFVLLDDAFEGMWGILNEFTGATSATFSIYGTTEVITHKIPSKFVGTDWNANEGEDGHIQNRTHWRETNAVVIPETTFEDNALAIEQPLKHKLAIGETYTVTVNGITYQSIAKQVEMYGTTVSVLGNIELEFGTGDTGEPFIYLEVPESEIEPEYPVYASFILTEPLESNTVSITIPEFYHKIDQKYLYTPDWNAKENEGGHILNRPFGEVTGLVDVLPEITLEIDVDITGSTIPLGSVVRDIVIGKTYIVNFNGIDYETESFEADFDGVPIAAVGNKIALGEGDTGEPFTILFFPQDVKPLVGMDGAIEIVDSSLTSATISMKESGTVIQKIPDKFLPTYDMEAPEGTEGHILNRTHYRMAFEPIICELITEGVDTITVSVDGREEQTFGYKFSDKILSLEILNQVDTYRIKSDGTKEKSEYEWEPIDNLNILDESLKAYQCINGGTIFVATKAGTLFNMEIGAIAIVPSTGMYFYPDSYNKFELSVEGNEIIQKLDAKFLPEGVAMLDDIPDVESLTDLNIVNGNSVGSLRTKYAALESEDQLGEYAFAEGQGTSAPGTASHAEGENTWAIGDYSHAEGRNTHALGKSSHTEGENTWANGSRSHAEGFTTRALGLSSHAEGAGMYRNIEGTISGDANATTYTYNGNDFKVGSVLVLNGIYAVIQSVDNINNTITVSNTLSNKSISEQTLQYFNGIAFADYAHAEGCNTTASGHSSHAEGINTIAFGDNSHAEGHRTTASGTYSHAEGCITTASGHSSHAEGFMTIASGNSQHVQGSCNIEDTASKYLHIVGNGNNYATGIVYSNAHTLDWNGVAWFADSVKVGGTGQDDDNAKVLATTTYVDEKVASMIDSAPDTLNTLNELAAALGDDPNFATTIVTQLGNKADLSIVPTNLINGNQIGSLRTVGATTSGKYAHAEGYNTEAFGECSHAEGYGTVAIGLKSHTEGEHTVTLGSNSHAEGYNTIAYGVYAHAEGRSDDLYITITGEAQSVTYTWSGSTRPSVGNVIIYGYDYVKIEAVDNINQTITVSRTLSQRDLSNASVRLVRNGAFGKFSHAEGYNTTTYGDYSHAEGLGTITTGEYQHVQGKYNIEDSENKYANIVGNGGAQNNRSNAHTLDWNGIPWTQGRPQFGGNAQDDGSQTVMANGDKEIILTSSTLGSTKQFKLTINDEGVLTATEIIKEGV